VRLLLCVLLLLLSTAGCMSYLGTFKQPQPPLVPLCGPLHPAYTPTTCRLLV